MGASDRRLAGDSCLGGGNGQEGQAVRERLLGLPRVRDDGNRSVPNCRKAARIADGDERREMEGAATVPALSDDLGADVPLHAPATRIVSLVPSLTEALAATAPDRLVGATDWCTHPAELDVTRVRGTKNPDLAAIRALSPDLVVANKEENR